MSQEKLKATVKQKENELTIPDKIDAQAEEDDVDLAPKEEESTDLHPEDTIKSDNPISSLHTSL